MKNKKKLIYGIIISVIIIAVICSATFLLIKKNRNNIESNTEETPSYNGAEHITFKSTLFNTMEKNGIRLEQIDIYKLDVTKELQIKLKNTQNTEVEELEIEINLLDKDGNVIALVSENINEKIPAHGEYKFDYSVITENNDEEIANVELVEVKNSGKRELEQIFDQ